MINTRISEEIDLLRETVRRFADEEIAPRAAEIDASNEFPADLWPKLGELGLHGITVPEEDGGTGLGYLAHVVAMEEISRASASVGLSYGAHSNLCLNNLWLNGTDEQRERFVPGLVSGEMLGALAMSEPGAGSDVVGSMSCHAERQDDGSWLANGSKMWITNGPRADVILTYMRTAPKVDGSRSITAFLVERDMPGFRTAQKLDKLGMRGSDTCELVFEDCRIPAENVLGEVNRGVYILMRGLDSERLVLSGGPIGSFGLMQGKLADMYTALQTSRAFTYRTAAQFDQGLPTRQDAAACLLHASREAVTVALEAIQSLGGNGYINEYPVARLLRDAKLYEIGAGTTEIRRMLIGRELLAAD